ncbi:toxin-antitoxin system HicB family antitoxin [Brevundimonas fluminis]|jgi:hypothetical protein|uniref:toxin-antitoxin system HicB family antitoxin n=1 Tax=Brevundimonas fluminis TaxID=2487274 RepID=UPI000F657E6D|nr:toxin-antitoxin system HicB family antitoxin [Brevundimonas fluminis]
MAGKAKKAFLLRASPEVMAAVERLAAAELRSVNAQVEMLLREALSRRGRAVPESRPSGGGVDDA